MDHLSEHIVFWNDLTINISLKNNVSIDVKNKYKHKINETNFYDLVLKYRDKIDFKNTDDSELASFIY